MRTWMVTGGTSGLGEEILNVLCRSAYRVGSRPIADRESAVVHDIRCDFTDWRGAVFEIERSIRTVGYLPNVLVNCAGKNLICETDEMEEQSFSDVFRVNVFFPLMLTAKLVKDNLFGVRPIVVNIGSSASTQAGAYSAAYVASKHALTGVTRSLAKDYGDRIRVCQINFGKLGGTKMSRYIDQRQAELRGITVQEERDRQRFGWKDGKEIPLRAAAQFVIEMVEEDFSETENGGVVRYGC